MWWEAIVEIFGYFLIFVAIDYKRKPESEIKFLSWDWFVTLLLVIVATILIR